MTHVVCLPGPSNFIDGFRNGEISVIGSFAWPVLVYSFPSEDVIGDKERGTDINEIELHQAFLQGYALME